MTTLAVGFGTGSWKLATGVALGEWLVKTVLFYFHEKVWIQIVGIRGKVS
ncbi:DUF2061 domain-containing protein, partial [bacterium]|nr:DUF2061 domain-containing protein [bacterium]